MKLIMLIQFLTGKRAFLPIKSVFVNRYFLCFTHTHSLCVSFTKNDESTMFRQPGFYIFQNKKKINTITKITAKPINPNQVYECSNKVGIMSD